MRKLFGTDGIRGKSNTYPMTAEMALKVGKAAAIVLRNRVKCQKSKISDHAQKPPRSCWLFYKHTTRL